MTLNALKLDCDNLVVGGGLAGLVAALRLKGTTVVASAGMGATAISGGVFSSSAKVPEVDRWFLQQLQSTRCPYVAGRCVTDLRVVREGLVQETADCDGAERLLVTLNGPPAPGMIRLDIPAFSGRSYQEIATLVDAEDGALETLAEALRGHGSEGFLLPPVLGVQNPAIARQRLEKAIGAPVSEYVTAPSVQGLRLLTALRGLVEARPGVTYLEPARIDSIADGVRGRMGTLGRRPFTVDASRLILATGGPLTGFIVEGDKVFEPLTGITVGDLEKDFDPLFVADHPLLFKGIGTSIKAVGSFQNVRSAGAVATGFGLYEALKAAYFLGE